MKVNDAEKYPWSPAVEIQCRISTDNNSDINISYSKYRVISYCPGENDLIF